MQPLTKCCSENLGKLLYMKQLCDEVLCIVGQTTLTCRAIIRKSRLQSQSELEMVEPILYS